MTDAPIERGGEGALSKLRDRKVVQWGLGYSAAAWTLLQLVEYLSETYGWPPAVRQLTTPALGFGLSFVLVIAWYHGDRGDQQVSKPESAILLGLAALLGGGLWWFAERLDVSAWDATTVGQVVQRAVPQDAASVAVLPFVNMSGDQANEYFSDGLSEEILNALSRIPRLYVPARTSSFYFKGRNEDVAVIAARLGVAAVLEGSVRKSGDRVRITAQLINAADGYHLWSQTYDRQIEDIFDIQSDIASAISEALSLRLSNQQTQLTIQAQPTVSTAAYEAYLLGRFESGKRDYESMRNSIAHFRKAVTLDPSFADAYARLAMALLNVRNADPVFYSPEQWAGFRAESRVQLDRAMALAPGRSDVLSAAGVAALYDDQTELALGYFNKALALSPSDGEILAWRSRVLRLSGRAPEAIAASYEAIQRDPLSMTALAEHFRLLRKYGPRDEIGPLIDRIEILDEATGQLDRAVIASDRGDRVTAVRHALRYIDLRVAQGALLEEARWVSPLVDALSSFNLREEVEFITKSYPTFALMTFGDFAKAIALLRPLVKENANWVRELAMALYLTEDYEAAAVLFERCLAERLGGCKADIMIWLCAADAARRTGQAQRARDWRGQAEHALQVDAGAGATADGEVAFDWALLRAYDGGQDAAARYLIVGMRTADFRWAAQHFPLLRPLAGRMDYRVAAGELEAVLDAQRVEVLEMLCGPNRVSKTYRPAPGTCANWKRSKS